MKIRKQARRKSFRYNVNRKRLRKNQTSTGKIKCPEIKEAWANKRSIKTNLRDMGLSLDPNQAVGLPNTKQERLKMVKLVNGFLEEDTEVLEANKQKIHRPRKEYVAKTLEEEAKAPREQQFRLPKGVVSNLSYYLDKYKFNYNGMVFDDKNEMQWTWRQFRGKIKKLMSISQQFDEYLKSRNLSREDLTNWEEYDTDKE